MHDMSNTRKEIAARLGFAAMGPAPLKGSPASKAEIAQLKAWSQFLKKEAQLSQKVQKINERKDPGSWDITSATQVRVFQNLSEAVQRGDKPLVRKLLKEAKREISDVVFREGVPQALIAWANTTTASRSGVKAAFAASLAEIKAWAQALKKEGQLSQKVQKANERKNPTEYDITSATEARVFLGLSDAVQRGDKMLVRKLLGEAKREISNVVFREGVPQALIAWASSTTASRPGAKTSMTREQTEEQKAGLKIMSAADPAVGAKIAKLIKEGKPQDQAVAIALDMKRRGEL